MSNLFQFTHMGTLKRVSTCDIKCQLFYDLLFFKKSVFFKSNKVISLTDLSFHIFYLSWKLFCWKGLSVEFVIDVLCLFKKGGSLLVFELFEFTFSSFHLFNTRFSHLDFSFESFVLRENVFLLIRISSVFEVCSFWRHCLCSRT